jgi:hypothetical protein
MTKIIAAIVLALVVATLFTELVRVIRRTDIREDYARTIRSMRWWMLPAALGQLIVVGAVYFTIINLVPVLSWGWWRLVGGSGNILLGQTGQTGIGWKVIGLLLPVVALLAVPSLAHGEEMIFRYRAEEQSPARRLKKQFLFGLWHFQAGVPVAACLALTTSGLYFLLVYLRACRRIDSMIPAVEEVPGPERLPYPKLPAMTGYDPEAWAAHDRERDRVSAENDRLFQQWSDELHGRVRAQVEATYERIQQIRMAATAKAAAAHAVSNWVVITVFIAWLIAGAVT